MLTGSQEVVSVSDITLVADKQKSTLLIYSRHPIGRFFCCNFLTIWNATTPNHGMVVIHVSTWSHLASVSSKGTLLVLINRVVIEVV